MEKLKVWWFYYHKRVFIIGGIIIFVSLFLGVGIWTFCFSSLSSISDAPKKAILVDQKVEGEKEEELSKQDQVTVDIKGAIMNPGIYTVSSSNRISDVILIAGGLREDGDTSVINLSRKVFDEMVIMIYTQDEVKHFGEVKEKEAEKQQACVIQEKIKNDACVCPSDIAIDVSSNTSNQGENTIVSDSQIVEKISLNQATLEELVSLPGIGESKAQLILEYRNSNQGFHSIDELKDIKGIGDSIFEKIKNYLTV